MRRIETPIEEKFIDYVKSVYSDNAYPIFVNPTRQELMDLVKESRDSLLSIRFCIWMQRNRPLVIVWNDTVLHEAIAKKLNIPYYNNSDAIFGEANFRGGKFVSELTSPTTTSLLKGRKKLISEYLSKNWKNPYIDITPLLEYYREVFLQ